MIKRDFPAQKPCADFLRRANPLNEVEWEQRVSESRNPSFFLGTPWARALVDTYGYRPHYLVTSEAKPLIFPWMEVNSWLTGRRGIALPFTDLCPTGDMSEADLRNAVQEITQYGTTAGWKYWEFRGGGELLTDIPWSTTFLNHRLQLGSCAEASFAQFNSTTRTAIRKAENSGVQVDITSELEAVEAFYQLLCRTRKRHGSPPQPFSFFRNLYNHVLKPGHGAIALGKVRGMPAAAIFFLHRGADVIYKYAAVDERLQQYRAGNLVLWRGIQHYMQRGASCLDFGRTSLGNHGLQRFKLAWGAEERSVGYIRYDFRARKFITVHDHASGWHTRVFRNLPTSIGQLVGRVLYRHAA